MATATVQLTFKCSDCKKTLPVPKGPGGTGYGLYPHKMKGAADVKVCYSCCAIRDREEMKTADRYGLYLAGNMDKGYEVTNWPGTLRMKVLEFRIGNHNMAGIGGRVDVWFLDLDGGYWHGVNIGDNDILRCRKFKRK